MSAQAPSSNAPHSDPYLVIERIEKRFELFDSKEGTKVPMLRVSLISSRTRSLIATEYLIPERITWDWITAILIVACRAAVCDVLGVLPPE